MGISYIVNLHVLRSVAPINLSFKWSLSLGCSQSDCLQLTRENIFTEIYNIFFYLMIQNNFLVTLCMFFFKNNSEFGILEKEEKGIF